MKIWYNIYTCQVSEVCNETQSSEKKIEILVSPMISIETQWFKAHNSRIGILEIQKKSEMYLT